MALKRNATANWVGTGKEGKGVVSTQSGVLSKNQYSFNSRFAEGIGTNPEELVAAAHAGCYAMKLSFNISGAGFTPDDITAVSSVTFDNGAIPNIHLDVKAKVPGLTKEKFAELAQDAKVNCPISKLLNTEITMTAVLL